MSTPEAIEAQKAVATLKRLTADKDAVRVELDQLTEHMAAHVLAVAAGTANAADADRATEARIQELRASQAILAAALPTAEARAMEATQRLGKLEAMEAIRASRAAWAELHAAQTDCEQLIGKLLAALADVRTKRIALQPHSSRVSALRDAGFIDWKEASEATPPRLQPDNCAFTPDREYTEQQQADTLRERLGDEILRLALARYTDQWPELLRRFDFWRRAVNAMDVPVADAEPQDDDETERLIASD